MITRKCIWCGIETYNNRSPECIVHMNLFQMLKSHQQYVPSMLKVIEMDEEVPGWRDIKYENGAPKFSPTGTLLDENGLRSIFDDVDE